MAHTGPMTLRSAPHGEPPEPSGASRAGESARWARRHALERELHDGPALRIAALSLQLGVLRQKLPEEDLRRNDIEDLQTQLHTALQELRRIGDLIYPPLLHEAGLPSALRELAGATPGRVRLRLVGDEVERYDHAIEATVYFAVTELLDELDPDAAPLDLQLSREGASLRLDVGPVDPRQTASILDHVQRVGGTVRSPARTGERITVTIPCA